MFIGTETDWPLPFIRNSSLLQNFISRGFLYSFIGLIAMAQATLERVRDMVDKLSDSLDMGGWTGIFMEFSAWFMVGIGWIYMVAGALCLKRVYDRLKLKEKDEWATYRLQYARWQELYGE
jgi:hypothetical protein